MVSSRYFQDQAIFRASAPSYTFSAPGSHGRWDFPRAGDGSGPSAYSYASPVHTELTNPPLSTWAPAGFQAQYPKSLLGEIKQEEMCFFQQTKAEKLGLCVGEKQGPDSCVGVQGMSMVTSSWER